MKTVSIMGIDGSGKTTVIKKFAEGQHWPLAYSFFCPDYHLSNLAPMRQLSLDAATLSIFADRIGHLPLKLLALYLKMSLFHSVQSFFAQNLTPQFLLSERNPLIDVLAYGKFYGGKSGASELSPQDGQRLLLQVENELPLEMNRLKQWIQVINRRTNKNLSLLEYPAFCINTLKQGAAHTIKTFQQEFQATFPDIIIFLDITPEDALKRLQQTKAITELHEAIGPLTILNKAYQEILQALPQIGISTRIFHLSAHSTVDEIEMKILSILKEVGA